MTHERLSIDELKAALNQLDGWQINSDDTAINRQYKFNNFKSAFAFMTMVAMKAEQMSHHPEWSNVYNRVGVTLTTHDSAGLTSLDITMAEFMDTAAAKLNH